MRRSRIAVLAVAALLMAGGIVAWIVTRPAGPDGGAPTATPTATPAATPVATPTDVPARSDLLPLTVTNTTGRAEPVHLYLLGQDLRPGGKLGHVDAAGTFTAWTGGQGEPVPAPDVAIPGPANGSATTVLVPRKFSGRLYAAFGAKLDLRLAGDGLVQPAPWSAGDPNRDILFDWTEFTFDDGGLWLNSTQVDQFAVPQVVGVTGPDGRTATAGAIDDRTEVIRRITAQPGFERTAHTRPDGTVLRVLAPGKASEAGLMDPAYLDPYIAEAWAAYRSKPLKVVPFADRPDVAFTGRTSGDVLNFTDASGARVASFTRPSTANVWGCDGALDAPNDKVVGPVARTLCAALHRSTLGRLDVQPSGTAEDFYQGPLTNHYSRVIHESMTDGRAYGFAFDDVQHQESLVHHTDPRRASVVLAPL